MSNKIPKQQQSLRMRAVERAEAARASQAAAERRRRRVAWGIGAGVALVLVVAVTIVVVVRGGDSEPAAVPSALAQQLGCSSCHTVDGARSEGPTWKGLAGSTVTLADGSTVTADEDYLRRSITDPAAQVVAGYQPTMPTVTVTAAQLDQLIAEMEAIGAN